MMIILNEVEWAEEVLRSGEPILKPYRAINILAKYFYHHKGLKKKAVITELKAFLGKRYPMYEIEQDYWNTFLDKVAVNAKKDRLYEIDGIWVTASELKKINDLSADNLKKVAFTMLCIAKLMLLRNENSNGWINYDTKGLFNLARVSCEVSKRDLIINKLHTLGYVENPKKNDNLNCRVLFIDDDSEKILFVSDFRELGYEYLKFRGESFSRCQECGILFRDPKPKDKKYKPRKYCNHCIAVSSPVIEWASATMDF